MNQSSGDHIAATITGTVSGQVAVGKDIAQTQQVGTAPPPTDAELEELHRAFAALKEEIAAQVPPESQGAALERIVELEEAVNAPEPDLSTMEYARRWFAKNLPRLAGAVSAVVVHPVVGKIVEAAGEAVATEFRHRFGQS